ncbi:MAG: hypothetical protein OXT67_10295 [Zetaproteobacteria bacterium]|nr:hypothetical protein [Zetaproteobacteria bacterium]
MQKMFMMMSVFLSTVCFANPTLSLEELERIERPQLQVGDTVKVKTSQGWKVAKVAKLLTASTLLASLIPGAEGGPALAAVCELTVCPLITGVACNPLAQKWVAAALSPVLGPMSMCASAVVGTLCATGATTTGCLVTCAAILTLCPTP